MANYRNHSTQFLFQRDRVGTRSSRFTAYVQDGCAFANQLTRLIDRSVRLKKRATVGKRIGRNIKYGHQLCLTLECQQSFSGSPNHLLDHEPSMKPFWLVSQLAGIY
jgi:hypothetical protein